nr:hypothetical protein Iba_scaffold14573CG0210 [Ipomoea batatas]GME21442.1 hypothetical protein Iba_scaffold27858CG0010 [Ipomoea batatas]
MQCLLEGEGEADEEERDPESSRRVRNRGAVNPILAMADILVFKENARKRMNLSSNEDSRFALQGVK